MILDVQNLSCRIQNKMLLDRISFSVERGEYVSVIGANGAGKSTLLRCLSRILTQWSGDVFLIDSVASVSGTVSNSATGTTPNSATGTVPNSLIRRTANFLTGRETNSAIGAVSNSASGTTPNSASGTTPNSATGTVPNSLIRRTANLLTGRETNSATRIIANSATGTSCRRRSLRTFSLKEQARRIAYVQQFQPLNFSLSVRDLVAMGRYPFLSFFSGFSSEDKSAVEEALSCMNLTAYADRSVETLSGGERQKVLLASAIAQKPQILLLDEPTTYLDYRRQQEMNAVLRRLNQEEKMTIIEVTHDLNRVAVCNSHVLALSQGQLLFDGSAQELISEPLLTSIYRAKFQLIEHPTRNIPLIFPAE